MMTLHYDNYTRCAPNGIVPLAWVQYWVAGGQVSRGTYNQEASLSLS